MEMLKCGKVSLPNTSRIFSLLEDMEKSTGLVHETCVDNFIVNAYWIRKDAEQEDMTEPNVQKAAALAALLDEYPVCAGWRDLDFLEIQWDGKA